MDLSTFTDNVLEQHRAGILSTVGTKIKEAEFSVSSYEGIDPEVGEIKVTSLESAKLQLIDVSRDGATDDIPA